ncbi:hypothetical protein D9611_002678 [Ephemerocybe angulata]|uniref:Uncharacterized protein n=1 Tax=Ephemerocybe angulata TaxID=980116 RepID=A0A8H5C1A2_9AGAR|nr:hypothetical protein D9611_002678 [Tulosesus angulatus]
MLTNASNPPMLSISLFTHALGGSKEHHSVFPIVRGEFLFPMLYDSPCSWSRHSYVKGGRRLLCASWISDVTLQTRDRPTSFITNSLDRSPTPPSPKPRSSSSALELAVYDVLGALYCRDSIVSSRCGSPSSSSTSPTRRPKPINNALLVPPIADPLHLWLIPRQDIHSAHTVFASLLDVSLLMC